MWSHLFYHFSEILGKTECRICYVACDTEIKIVWDSDQDDDEFILDSPEVKLKTVCTGSLSHLSCFFQRLTRVSLPQDLALRASGAFLVVVVVCERSHLYFEKSTPRDFGCFTASALDLFHWEFQMSKISSRSKISIDRSLTSLPSGYSAQEVQISYIGCFWLWRATAFRLLWRSHFSPQNITQFL